MDNTFLTSESLDFDSLRSQLIEYLKSQSRFQDYDFEGSNMSVLLDILSYNTYHNMFFLNMVGNEMFLDTALLRESVNSRAKMLNYVPKSRASSVATVSLTIVPSDAPDAVFVPKYFPIFSQAGGNNLKFTTNEPITIRNNGGVYSISNVTIFEGNIVNEYFEINDSNTNYVTLQSSNVDTTSIVVNVRTSNTVSTNTDFTQAYNLYGVSSNSNVYFLEPYGDSQYRLIFGNNVLGKKLDVGNVVKVTYRDSKGVDGDGATAFTSSATVGNNYPVYITTQSKSSGGSERETIESIKYNAPRHFATQDRAVTEQDFRVLIYRQFPQLESVTVYGGERANPKKYGKVIVAAKPYGGTYISQALKGQIISYLKDRNTVAIDPIIIDPKYMYVEISSTVYYSSSKSEFSPVELETEVRKSIRKFNSTELSSFDSDFRYSKLVQYIDNSSDGVVSNDTSCRLILRISPLLNTPTSYTLDTNNELFQAAVPYKIVDGNETTISSGLFQYINNNVEYSAYIVDDGLGNLKVVTDTNDKGRVVLNESLGTVNYKTGLVVINSLSVSDYTGSTIKLYFKTKNKDIIIDKEYILQIDDRDVTLNVKRAEF